MYLEWDLTSTTVVADPTDDSEAVSESALRSRRVLRRAMPRPRVADVAERSVEAVPVAVPGDEFADELDVTWRACLVMAMKRGDGGRGVGKGRGIRRRSWPVGRQEVNEVWHSRYIRISG